MNIVVGEHPICSRRQRTDMKSAPMDLTIAKPFAKSKFENYFAENSCNCGLIVLYSRQVKRRLPKIQPFWNGGCFYECQKRIRIIRKIIF